MVGKILGSSSGGVRPSLPVKTCVEAQRQDIYEPGRSPPVTLNSGWAQRVGSRIWSFCLPLIPSPVLTALHVVMDVAAGARRQSHFEHRREFASAAEAEASFEVARDRLLSPNEWREFGPGPLAARFQLVCGEKHSPKAQQPEAGDYLQIKLPDPGPPVWVRVEDVEASDSEARMVVRPSPRPGSNAPNVIVHLFGEETTNEFIVQQEGNTVTASVTGHNEIPNYSGNVAQDLFAAVRLAGAWMGAKKPQWNTFTRRILEE